MPTVQALLKGQGLADQLPTVAIVAHYDTFGVSTVSVPVLMGAGVGVGVGVGVGYLHSV